MKLRRYRVKEFRSIWDSGVIDVDERTTCLVGKNESGKTALLQALYKTNPIEKSYAHFDLTYDYPKREVEDYRLDVETGKRDEVVVTWCEYSLDQDDKNRVAELLGDEVLCSETITHQTYYGHAKERHTLEGIQPNDRAAREHLVRTSDLPRSVSDKLLNTENWQDFHQTLLSGVDIVEGGLDRLENIVGSLSKLGLAQCIIKFILWPRAPKFLYFDEYSQMRGQENLNALIAREQQGELSDSDRPLLGLMHLARLDYRQLSTMSSTAELKNRLEGAGNYLTRRIAKYWSQNRHIQMRFDVREARPEDPVGMQSGVNIWGEIYDSVHWSTTPLGVRSRGFLWFFSFLAWYEHVRRQGHDLILLLDEPGLSLHGKAQGDLLRYFEEELTEHQLIYSTHSPFMVDPRKFDRVRIVQDLGIDADEELPRDRDGTKVLENVFGATEESLFPLHGALGLEVQQTLFIGPNSLIVEGASDLLYLRAVSGQLEAEGRTGLSEDWVITPVGGSSKVPTFVALLAPQRGMNVVVLVDAGRENRAQMDDLYKKKLLHRREVRTYADYLEGRDADVEDMFSREFYVELVNREFDRQLTEPISLEQLDAHEPRTVKAIEAHLAEQPMREGRFSHYRPARYFSERAGELWGEVPEETKARFESLFRDLDNILH